MERIGEAIVDALNDDGYLTLTTAEIARDLSADLPVTEADVEQLLALVQTLDPAGVGARTLSECLILQLAQLDEDTPGRDLAIGIARDHLQSVADKDLATLRRGLGVDEDSLQVALALVRSCHPRDVLQLIIEESRFVKRPAVLEPGAARRACEVYFAVDPGPVTR